MITLCYIESCPIDRIRTVLRLDQLIENCNNPEVNELAFEFNQATILRVNWMVNNLKIEPMRKPIVVDSDWQTIVGDTRLMALKILRHTHVPVLAQLQKPEGVIIKDLHQLRQICGFDQHALVQWNPSDRDLFSQAVEWFDIGDNSTAHHCWDREEAKITMRRYLSAQSADFRFSEDWCSQQINWQQYRSQ